MVPELVSVGVALADADSELDAFEASAFALDEDAASLEDDGVAELEGVSEGECSEEEGGSSEDDGGGGGGGVGVGVGLGDGGGGVGDGLGDGFGDGRSDHSTTE